MKYRLLALSLFFIAVQVKAESAYLGAALTKVNKCYYYVKIDHKGNETLKICAEADKFLGENISNIKQDLKSDNWTEADTKDLNKLVSRDKQNKLTLGTYKPVASKKDNSQLALANIYSRWCNKDIKTNQSTAASSKYCKTFKDAYSKNETAFLEQKNSKEGFTEVDNENWIKITKTNNALKSLK